MKIRTPMSMVLLLSLAIGASAAEHRVELTESEFPDEVSNNVASEIDKKCFQIIRGTSRTVCEIWLCKEWAVKKDFAATNEVLYPFRSGQLIGVARFPRKGSDFRDQDIESGVYTLRYAQQPVDGSHVGTSPTRDFLLLVSAEHDQDAKDMKVEDLVGHSAEAAGSGHPAMLCLQRVEGKASDKPSMRHNEEHDWWILKLQGTQNAGKETKELPVDLVVVGISSEV